MNGSELARREERAQHGIIQFAEEMQAIRDGKLYPNAGETHGGKLEPWDTYCRERWGMSKKSVDDSIRALPVLQRYSSLPAGERAKPSVTAAAAVATLPEPVQDAILIESPRRDAASDKAKAARKEQKRIREQEAREPEPEELIEAANAVKAKKKAKPKLKDSKFVHALEMAYFEAERAADIANSTVLDDTENDYGWDRVGKIEYELARIKDRLYKPDHVRDVDDEFAGLLGGEER